MSIGQLSILNKLSNEKIGFLRHKDNGFLFYVSISNSYFFAIRSKEQQESYWL